MGLDYLELVLVIEDQFCIDEIDERDLYDVSTPAGLIDVVSKYVNTESPDTCITVKRFNYLRKTLHEEFGVEKRQVKMESVITELIPNMTENELWKELQFKLVMPDHLWPALGFSKPVSITINTIAWLTLLLVFFMLGQSITYTAALVGTGILMIVTFILIGIATRKCGTEINEECKTIRSIIPLIQLPGTHHWSRRDIEQEIRTIVIDKTGMSPENYHENIDFFKDLGMG